MSYKHTNLTLIDIAVSHQACLVINTNMEHRKGERKKKDREINRDARTLFDVWGKGASKVEAEEMEIW